MSVAGCACAAGRRCACAQAAHPGEEVKRVVRERTVPHTLVTVQAGRTGAERLVAPQLERLDVCRELHILHRLTVAESWRAPRGVTSRGADQCRPPSRLVQSREVVRQQATLWRGQRGERRAASGLLSSRWHRARGARARAHPLGSRCGRQKLAHGQGGGPSAAARSEVFCHRLARLKHTENTQTRTYSWNGIVSEDGHQGRRQ